jgi:hypothetical protein
MRTYVRSICPFIVGLFAVGLLCGCGVIAGAMIGAGLTGVAAEGMAKSAQFVGGSRAGDL